MLRKCGRLILCVSLGLCAAGCPKGHAEYGQGEKAETLQDYDAALSYYQKAVKSDPHNATFRIRLNQARFEAGEMHIKRGLEMRKRGELDGAVRTLVTTMLARSPAALCAMKDFFRSGPRMEPRGQADYAANLLANVLASARK